MFVIGVGLKSDMDSLASPTATPAEVQQVGAWPAALAATATLQSDKNKSTL
jgi:hypothetical protein